MSQINEEYDKDLREDERKKRRKYVFWGVAAMVAVIVLAYLVVQRLDHKSKAAPRQTTDTTSQHTP